MISFSNVGRVPTTPVKDGFVKITEQYFSVSVRRNFGGVFFTVLTYNDQMCFCIGYDGNWFSEDVAQVLITDIKKSVLDIGNF